MPDSLFWKGLVLGIILMFIGVSIIPSTIGIEKINTTIKTIGSRGYIQDLLNNASDGDTIFIPSGIYYENITIDKSISLIGEDKNTTIIDGKNIGNVVTVTSDWVNISGFTIQNSNLNVTSFAVNIESSNITIMDNIISNNHGGIYIDGNTPSNTIVRNNINSNYADGIIIYSDSNHISDNMVSNNTVGINVWQSDNNNIYGNNILNNEYGISFGAVIFCSDNHMYHNNLIDNIINAYDNENNIWDNGYPSGGNYWDDYTGEDNNGDGIGDTPYNISQKPNQDEYPLMNPWGKNLPIANFTYTYNASDVVFIGSESYDRDGEIISYQWDFGDGHIDYGEIVSHKYCDIGTFNVTLSVIDNDGLQGNITKSVETIMANIPPLSPDIYGPNHGKPDDEYEYVFFVEDPDNDDIFLHIDWGDGDSTGWIGPLSSIEYVKSSHIWNESGTYVIKTKLKDYCGDGPETTYEIKMNNNKAINTPFQWLHNYLQSHPNLFPIIRQILGL